jgi:hypothetical protein
VPASDASEHQAVRGIGSLVENDPRASLSQEVGMALGAQAGQRKLTEVIKAGGFSRVRRAAETPLNMILEALHWVFKHRRNRTCQFGWGSEAHHYDALVFRINERILARAPAGRVRLQPAEGIAITQVLRQAVLRCPTPTIALNLELARWPARFRSGRNPLNYFDKISLTLTRFPDHDADWLRLSWRCNKLVLVRANFSLHKLTRGSYWPSRFRRGEADPPGFRLLRARAPLQ